MTLESKVRGLLQDKPSYLKCGPNRIADALSIYRPTEEMIDEIRSVKKAVNKELKRQRKTSDLDPNFIRQFEAMAKQLGYTKGDETPSSKAKMTPEKNNFRKERKKAKLTPPPIADQVGMHILIGCNHVPFHNVEMHDGLLELIKDHKRQIKGFHLMGDFMDLNSLSSHDRGRFTAVPGLTLDEEYEAGNDLLDQFDAVLPKKAWKTYLYGNHEDRWNRWMSQFDNAKTPLQSPEDALDLAGRGYQVKDNWKQDYFTIGSHLDILHGIYYSIHCAKAHLDKLRGSCAFVHTHRQQTFIEGNMGAFNIGSGADFDSPAFNYATRPMKGQWSNGFAVVMIEPDGSYNITQITFRNGSFYFGGKRYGRQEGI